MPIQYTQLSGSELVRPTLIYLLLSTNTQGEMTSQNLWSRYVRHFVGITWHDVLS